MRLFALMRLRGGSVPGRSPARRRGTHFTARCPANMTAGSSLRDDVMLAGGRHDVGLRRGRAPRTFRLLRRTRTRGVGPPARMIY